MNELDVFDDVIIDPLHLFRKSILDQTKDYPLPVPIINLIHHGSCIPFLTRKSLSLWQGKQKSKKTTALAIAVAALIAKRKSQDNVRFESVRGGTILFFDCEQGESYAARTMKLILNIANVSKSKNLIYSDLRPYSPSERFKIIESAIENTQNVILVIVDGLVDLMSDFMSAEEGHTIITDLLKLTSEHDIHIAGVLHQNKGQSRDARAHVGSIASQKCEREIMIEVDTTDKNRSVVFSKESRDRAFPNFAIMWTEDKPPQIDQDWSPIKYLAPSKETLPDFIPIETHKAILETIFTETQKQFGLADFKEKAQYFVSQKVGSTGKNKIDSFIKCWLNLNLIIKTGKPRTKSAKYQLNNVNQLN